MFINIPKPEEMAPKPVDPGIYKAVVAETKVGQSQAGNTKIQVKLQLLSEGVQGKIVWETLTITEAAIWRVNNFFKACTGKDLPEGQISIDELANLITAHIANKELTVRLDIGKDLQGREINTVVEVAKA